MTDDRLGRALDAVSRGDVVREALDPDGARSLDVAARLDAAARTITAPPGAFARAVAAAPTKSPLAVIAARIAAAFALAGGWLRRAPATALLVLAVLLATGIVGIAAAVIQRPATPIVASGCDAALAERRAAVTRVDAAHARSVAELRTSVEQAQQNAVAERRSISPDTIAALAAEATAVLDRLHAEGLAALRSAADLGSCEPTDPDTGAVFDIADLRQRYAVIVARIVGELDRTGQAATARLAAAVRDAPQRSLGSVDDD